VNTEALDFLIVGQGLAGSLLAWELVQRGQRVVVLDDDWRDSSSIVAAGLVNPVTGKRLTLQPDAEAWLGRTHETYATIETALGTTLYQSKPLLRLFTDTEQHEYFLRRQQDPAHAPFWEKAASAADLAPFDAPWGGAWQAGTGFLDTAAFLAGVRDWLQRRGAFKRAAFDYAELALTDSGVRWRNLSARALVFCEGFGGIRNPWFGALPFQPAKGEILTLEWQGSVKLPDAIINKGIWLAPRPDGRWRLGATHQWDPLDCEPTQAGSDTLMKQLGRLTPGAQARILHRGAGVRPATRDRAPFLGRHGKHPQLAVFNGFGAKGSLLIPRCASIMADHLCQGAKLPPELDIGRYG